MAVLHFADSFAFERPDRPLRGIKIKMELELTERQLTPEARDRILLQALTALAHEVARGRSLSSSARDAAGAPSSRLHKKSERSVHKFLVAVADLAQGGYAPTLGEVGQRARLSGPPLAKIVNPKTPAGAYAGPLIRVRRDGQAKRVTLTARGRRVVQRITAVDFRHMPR